MAAAVDVVFVVVLDGAMFDVKRHGKESDDGLARADISLQQATHGLRRSAHVGKDLLKHRCL